MKTLQVNEVINRAVWGNTYDYCDTAMTVGFKTNTYRFSEQEKLQYTADFLKTSMLHRYDTEQLNTNEIYLDDAGVCTLSLMGKRDHDRQQAILLPPVTAMQLDMSLDKALLSRRSQRTFQEAHLSFKNMAQTLQAAAGITGKANVVLGNGAEVELSLRAAPSAGALYPIDLYVATQQVEHVKDGVYFYDPGTNTLIAKQDSDKAQQVFRQLHANSADAHSYAKANLIILLIANPWRSMRKYGPRGLRFLMQECGAMSQNIHLATVAQGLNSVDSGGFYDEEIHALLELDGVYQSFLHAVVVGS